MKQDDRQVSHILKLFLKAYGLEDKYTERELFARWEELVGAAVYNRTTKIKFSKGYLLVFLNSSTIRAELNMRKTELLTQINQKMRSRLVKEITFK
jgi:predicted nucleic acid-binding Zn ribbon protein